MLSEGTFRSSFGYNGYMDTISTGMHVEVELITAEGAEPLAFDIVPDASADFARGFLGENTPMARALMGRQPGERVAYSQGDILAVYVRSVAPAKEAPPPNVVERRKETMRKAVEQSDRTNALIFASSFNGKWGDYDPTGFTEDWDQSSDKAPDEDERA